MIKDYLNKVNRREEELIREQEDQNNILVTNFNKDQSQIIIKSRPKDASHHNKTLSNTISK
ncbi:25225_t:CDS:2, partial [Gigaspora margarita]